MLRTLLRPRPGAIAASTLVATLTWFQTALTGVDRAVNVLASFLVAYVAFNATTMLVECHTDLGA